MVALGIIEAIYDAHPEFIREEDSQGQLPLHKLCANLSWDETTTIAILRLLLEKYPESIRHASNDGHLPIQTAAKASKSPELSKPILDPREWLVRGECFLPTLLV